MVEHTVHRIKGDDTRIGVRASNPFKGPQVMIFDCTFEQYMEGYRAYQKGAPIQNAFPFLNSEEREFLISGFTPEDWAETFGR